MSAAAAPKEADPLAVVTFKTPKQTLVYVIKAGMAKAALPWWEVLILSFMAGMYIGVGGVFSIMVAGGVSGAGISGSSAAGLANPGVVRLLAGLVFPIALLLVVVMGAELFTGNTMYLFCALLERKVKLWDLARNWVLSFIGNFLGCAACAYFLVYLADLTTPDPWHSYIIQVSEKKIHQGFGVLFLKGVGCNWLVCCALYFGLAAQDMFGKVIALWWPVAAFTAIGWEHSIANMFFVSLGLMEGADSTFGEFLYRNLIPVTLGNIVGGSILVGLVQWQAFSPYFGDAVVKMQVRAGNLRHRIADHLHLHHHHHHQAQTPALPAASVPTICESASPPSSSASESPATGKDDSTLLATAPTPIGPAAV